MKRKYVIQLLQEHREKWSDVDVSQMSEDRQEKFRLRKLALDMYIDGETKARIESVTSRVYASVLRDVERCLYLDSNGYELGYRGLLQNKHINKNINL